MAATPPRSPPAGKVWADFLKLRAEYEHPYLEGPGHCPCSVCSCWQTLEAALTRFLGVITVGPEDTKALLNSLLDALRELHSSDGPDRTTFTVGPLTFETHR